MSDHYKVRSAHGYRLVRNESALGTWYCTGYVVTPLGYVDVYMHDGHTQFRAIQDGHEHSETFQKSFSKRGLVTVARRFIEGLQP